MKTFRTILIYIEIAMIIVIVATVDYSNLISRPNLGSLLGIISMLLAILALYLSNRHDDREAKRSKSPAKK